MKFFNDFKLLISIVFAVFCLALIVFVNYQQIGDWFGSSASFGKNGPANLGSIEVSYVSMGRFLTDFGFQSFAPFWYFGFPFHLFYTPLLPILEALINKIFGIPLWESYRLITGLGYIAAPISVFFLGWQLSKRVIGGLIAGIFFSVGPTIFYFLDPGVALDKFSLNFWDPRRFTILVRWGEGPHIFSLIFVPLVGLFFSKLLEDRRFRWLVLSSIFLGLAGLTNAIGLFSSILLVLSLSFVKFAQAREFRARPILSGVLVGLLALGLISFWYNLSFIANFFGEGEAAGNIYLSLFPWGWVGILLGIGGIYFIFRNIIKDFAIATALLWFLIFFTVVFVYYLTESVELLPQALRYNVEVDLSLSLLIGVLFAWLVGIFAKRLRYLEIAGNVVGLAIVFGLILYIQPFIPTASKAAGTVIDIKNTGEYEIASFLKDNINEEKGERVFVPGNYGFYLNWFTNVWQPRGGLFQASTHYWTDHMHYQLRNGKNADIARAWLTAGNIKYAVFTTIGSRDLYKEIKNQERFSDYNVVYEERGDIIYEVPLKKSSLAKSVSLLVMKQLAVPKKADDKKAILAYADWIENSSAKQNSLIVVDNDHYRIKGEVGDGEGILVQMTADSGWAASNAVSGNSIKTGRDPLGFLILYPQAGEVDITLKHGRIWQEWLGYLLTIGTVGFVVWYGTVGRKKQSSGS